jgi:hypothetical protein
MSASKVAEMAGVSGQKAAAQRLRDRKMADCGASAPFAVNKADLP